MSERPLSFEELCELQLPGESTAGARLAGSPAGAVAIADLDAVHSRMPDCWLKRRLRELVDDPVLSGAFVRRETNRTPWEIAGKLADRQLGRDLTYYEVLERRRQIKEFLRGHSDAELRRLAALGEQRYAMMRGLVLSYERFGVFDGNADQLFHVVRSLHPNTQGDSDAETEAG